MGASSRMRFMQYLPYLRQSGIQVTVQSLLSDELLKSRYEIGRYGLRRLLSAYGSRCSALINRHKFDVVWVEKEALPWWPLWLELLLLRNVPYVLDYDDAVFHYYDKHSNSWIRRFYGQRLDKLMANASLVVAGNSYLAERASVAGSRRVEVVPTVVDLKRYPQPQSSINAAGRPRIVWIGSPSTLQYLNLLDGALRMLAKRQSYVLRVIGGRPVSISNVSIEEVPWEESTEVENIKGCAVGIMPLLDSAWERGKCGYKLIQYMACGIPVVASPVGVNDTIVANGVSGFLASTEDEWVESLERLVSDAALRASLGMAGRERVEREYCLQRQAPRLVEMLHEVART